MYIQAVVYQTFVRPSDCCGGS